MADAMWRRPARARTLDDLVDALPLRLRAVFVMRAVEAMNAADVADVLGVPVNTVRVRLLRARVLLHAWLADMLGRAAPRLYRLHASRSRNVADAVLTRIRSTRET